MLVPVYVNAGVDSKGIVMGWGIPTFEKTGASCPELDAAMTAEGVRRGIESAREQAFWASNEGAWDRHMERLESVCDIGPECPEVEE